MKVRFLLIAALMVLLGACGLAQKSYEGAKKISKETFSLKHYRYDLTVVSNLVLNTTDNSPINTFRIGVFQLSDDDLFKQASYYDLLIDAKKYLDKDLVKQDYELIFPFSKKQLLNDIDQRTRYLGLVFFFNKPGDEATWKITLPINEVSIFKTSYILADGSSATFVDKAQLNELLNKQKQVEEANKKALEESHDVPVMPSKPSSLRSK